MSYAPLVLVLLLLLGLLSWKQVQQHLHKCSTPPCPALLLSRFGPVCRTQTAHCPGVWLLTMRLQVVWAWCAWPGVFTSAGACLSPAHHLAAAAVPSASPASAAAAAG